jgi:hypothetical protein
MVDWNHIHFDAPPDHYVTNNLNRVRLDELREVTRRYFDIEDWLEVPDDPRVLRRLTPEVWSRLHGFSQRELLTKHVICLAQKREGAHDANA